MEMIEAINLIVRKIPESGFSKEAQCILRVLKLMILDLFQSEESLSVVLSEFQKNISIKKSLEKKKNMGLLLWSVFDGVRKKNSSGTIQPSAIEISNQCAHNLSFMTGEADYWQRVLKEAVQEDYNFLFNFISFI